MPVGVGLEAAAATVGAAEEFAAGAATVGAGALEAGAFVWFSADFGAVDGAVDAAGELPQALSTIEINSASDARRYHGRFTFPLPSFVLAYA